MGRRVSKREAPAAHYIGEECCCQGNQRDRDWYLEQRSSGRAAEELMFDTTSGVDKYLASLFLFF